MITLENINDKINFRGMIAKFQDILIERLQASMAKKKVGNSKNAKGNLLRSFRKAMLYSGNNMQKASVSFLAYGRMVDGGWGAETNANDRAYYRQVRRQTGETPKRKRKPWYSKTKAGQIKRFRELMVAQYGGELVAEAEQALTNSITVNNIL